MNMKKIKFLSIFLIFFSSVALGDDKYTLIVMLGDKLLDKNIYFKDKNKCTYFANKMNSISDTIYLWYHSTYYRSKYNKI